jgi:tRNA (guanine-N7-)-methyltransferase
MKPKDLVVPFGWDDRSILINDRIWYVPERTPSSEDFIFPGWDHADFFGNFNPVCMEYCSGNGAWIAAKAMSNPSINWVAVEKKIVRVRKIWSKIKNLKLNNLLVICGEGYHVTKHYFSDAAIENIYINFPDPWPKHRHFKHRLIQPTFLNELRRILKAKGILTFVTDDLSYSQWTIRHMGDDPNFISLYQDPYYVTEWSDYGTSYFDQLWRERGKTIRYHQFQKLIP